MAGELPTFCDQVLLLLQSAAARAVRAVHGIGHGAVPVFASASETAGRARIADPPQLREDVHRGVGDQICRCGFTTIRFGRDGSAAASYYDSTAGTGPTFNEIL